MNKPSKPSKAGSPLSKRRQPFAASTNPPNRIWISLPAWAKAALREIAKEDGRASTRQACIMLVDQIASRLGPARLMEFQKRYVTPASTEASE